MAILVIISVVFGIFSYRVSLRVVRGPQNPVSNPCLRYVGSTLLAIVPAWFVVVFGMVLVGFNTSFVLVFVAFFVPAWLSVCDEHPDSREDRSLGERRRGSGRSLTLTPQRKPGRSRALMATPMSPSWNQVVGFLTEREGLRRLAA